MKRLLALMLCAAACGGLLSTGCSSIDGGAEALVTTESDMDLMRTIQDRLRQDPMTRHVGVVVRARNGNVKLSGSVVGEPTRLHVLSIVRDTEGVSAVEDNMRVTPVLPGYRPVRMP